MMGRDLSRDRQTDQSVLPRVIHSLCDLAAGQWLRSYPASRFDFTASRGQWASRKKNAAEHEQEQHVDPAASRAAVRICEA